MWLLNFFNFNLWVSHVLQGTLLHTHEFFVPRIHVKNMHLENSRAPFIIFNSSLDAYILGKNVSFYFR